MRLLARSSRLLFLTAALAFAGLSAPAAGQAPAKARQDPTAAIVERCRSADRTKEIECYSAALDAALTSGGPAPALQLLDRLAAADPDVRRDGHMYAHQIGISALKSPSDVGKVFASCTPAHQSGCYHGVIQSYFMAAGRAGGGVTTESVDALCGDYRGTRADLLFQCTHGLGHGLAILHRHDLPQALGSCDLLSREPEREMCYAGAFMESIVKATIPHHSTAPPKAESKAIADHSRHGGHADHSAGSAEGAAAKPPFRALDPADLHYPCSALDDKYLIACYTIQTSAMLHHMKQDVVPVAAECGRAPEKARATCFLSLGRDVSSLAVGNNAEAIRLCGLAGASFRPVCHRGVVESIVNMNANPDEGIPYCRALPEEESKRACYTAVGLQALVLPEGEAKRERACRTAEPAMLEACLGRPASTES